MAWKNKMSRRKKTTLTWVAASALGAGLLWWFWKDIFGKPIQPTRTWFSDSSVVKLPPGIEPPAPRKIYTEQELEYYGERAKRDPVFKATLPPELLKLI